MRKTLTALAAAALLAIGAAALAGCSNAQQDGAPDGNAADGKPTLTVAMELAYPPFETKDDAGNPAGIAVDFMQDFADQYGYDLVVENTAWDGLIPSLQTGKADCVISSMTITDERKKAVSFAGPYFVAGQDLMVRADDHSINGPEDLNGKRLCSVTGSTSAKVVKEKFAKEVQLMEQPGYAECATALFSGIVDAVTTDDIILAGLASASRGKLRVVGKPFTQEYYGVGIKKGDTAFAKQINAAIEDMIKSGEWERAIEKNTEGTDYQPDPKYNPPTPDEGE